MNARPKTQAATAELDALREVDFDWTRQLNSIWRDGDARSPVLHEACLTEILADFDRRLRNRPGRDEPLGRVIVGPAGFGKTHLIGELRRRVAAREGWFILLDLVGVKDFWSSVALGFLDSIQKTRGNNTQHAELIVAVAKHLSISEQLATIVQRHPDDLKARTKALVRHFHLSLGKRYREDASNHADVVTALMLLRSEDFDQRSFAHAWLQGMELDPQERWANGVRGTGDPRAVVRGISWLMSLVGPTMIAVDQIDAIVTAAKSKARAASADSAEQREASAIVDALAQGLMDLHDTKLRAMTVVSCLETTWEILRTSQSVPVTDRYWEPVVLKPMAGGADARGLVEARLAEGYGEAGFVPPYPTYPFLPEAFEGAAGWSPRVLLKACDRHRIRCLRDGTVSECASLAEAPATPPPPPSTGLDAQFASCLAAARTDGLLDPENEDTLHAIFEDGLHLLEHHFDLPDDVDLRVPPDPDQRRPSLHGRLTFTFRSEGEREEHFCFRILGHDHAVAFQSRLKAAMTASGIDTALRFRRLFVLRAAAPPSGAKTQAMVSEFTRAGGHFVRPVAEDLKLLVALRDLAAQKPPELKAWLQLRKPLFDAPLFKTAGLCPPAFLAPPAPGTDDGGPRTDPPAGRPAGRPAPRGGEAPSGRGPAPSNPETKGARTDADPANGTGPASSAAEGTDIILGRRAGTAENASAVLPRDLLNRHVAIFAGSGSGKTVFLRRLVEEGALLGIPAIVLDVNNDLARLGDPWPQTPESFSPEDVAKAARYHAGVEVVVWTPGISSGNPLSLGLLPDFAAIGDGRDSESNDERGQAVEMARATLTPYLGGGGGQRANLKQGVLADALRRFAQAGGRDLRDFVALLGELPEGVSQIRNAERLAGEMADQLLAAIATNPLLQSNGPRLDPGRLFHGADPARPRISVINLAGLATESARESFVNQLQMTLFTWVKQNPSPAGRLYVLDEAQNFAPSQAGTACKASTRALAAQARKYGLGMVFATQLPRGIDSGIVSNCTTHLYGRMSSPATIEATRDLMAAKGGAADDLGRLAHGRFYFSTQGIPRPVKIETSLCLSWHPANPPTAAEVVKAARASRTEEDGGQPTG